MADDDHRYTNRVAIRYTKRDTKPDADTHGVAYRHRLSNADRNSDAIAVDDTDTDSDSDPDTDTDTDTDTFTG